MLVLAVDGVLVAQPLVHASISLLAFALG